MNADYLQFFTLLSVATTHGDDSSSFSTFSSRTTRTSTTFIGAPNTAVVCGVR
jgi:hypothetical protein